ncbi:ciliogenesis and planar polarity effector 2 isoform X2 [Betta splendens]|uniref:Ciliogenesis and planar polarity effector 2 n=1 Tax=Betta splendens TaxID=158456 RepID=A0A6P7MPZ7_BETSP|nr:ciliogenesis and planar polarity effector 2 isoform X2 [Betta splendens]
MSQNPATGSVVVSDWHRCKDGKEYFNKILHRKKRKIFGKSGVGKTALAARLTGRNIPNVHYETTGVETTVVFWPVKLRDSGRVLFLRLQLWDCGENALRRFDHLLPSCKEQVDAVLFLFSFTDRTSFDDLPNQISKWTEESAGRLVKLVVGTKFDLFMHCDVAQRDVRDFQETWRLPVLRVGGEVSNGLDDVSPLLNCLAEQLWHHDCVTAGSVGLQQETVTLL